MHTRHNPSFTTMPAANERPGRHEGGRNFEPAGPPPPLKLREGECVICGAPVVHWCYCGPHYLDWRHGEKESRDTWRKTHWRTLPKGQVAHALTFRAQGSFKTGGGRKDTLKHKFESNFRLLPDGRWQIRVKRVKATVFGRSKAVTPSAKLMKPASVRPRKPTRYEGMTCCEEDCTEKVYSCDRCLNHAASYQHARPREEFGGLSYNQVYYLRNKEKIKKNADQWAKENKAARNAIKRRYRANNPEARKRDIKRRREAHQRTKAAA